MPPATSRRAIRDIHAQPLNNVQSTSTTNADLFTDPMMGCALSIYIDKDVEDKERILQLITNHGGVVSPGYSSVSYILVDPHKESGQALYRQYVNRKGKLVLDARWIYECIKHGQLQTFKANWAGCKLDGTEKVGTAVVPAQEDNSGSASRPVESHQQSQPSSHSHAPIPAGPATHSHAPILPGPATHPHAPIPPGLATHSHAPIPPGPATHSHDPIPPGPATHSHAPIPHGPATHPHAPIPPGPATYVPYPYSTAHSEPSWHDTSGIPPQATHLQHVMSQPTRHPNSLWQPPPSHYQPLDATDTSAADYPDYARYRPDQDWAQGEYYPEQFAPYDNSDGGYLEIEGPPTSASVAPPPESTTNQPHTLSTEPGSNQPRGRKRTRSTAHNGPINPSALVPPKGPPARSPTPPTRVLKSTYGGNLYTADDVEYLKKYIDYCQDQGLVLSLREICERIAVKAPHHTWRRYCNKHQIRLGAYQMDNNGRSPSPAPIPGAEDEPILEPTVEAASFPLASTLNRNRSPTPPRALTRSTTGKGIAFTQEDVNFLMRFLEYRKSREPEVDMVQFWKDVAERAPHHSRASWMKYWRRHKHELEPDDSGQPPVPPPEKKVRYSSGDDILLARYFASRPQGTSDQIFQNFAKMHSHHPWKGWQEHHRIHKKTVDHYVKMINNGQPIDSPPE